MMCLQCFKCAHYRVLSRCAAFPDGIPKEVMHGGHDHTKPYPGDNGILFTPIEEGEESDVGDTDEE